jgi:hypothetical protein
MGRFYNGDIEGKFWFGIQNSNDVEELVTVTHHVYYSWNVCGCTAEIHDYEYCKECYDSKEEHINAAIDEGACDDDNGCLYYEDQMVGYSLDKETHYLELMDNMNKLKEEIGEDIIAKFDKIERNDDILDAFTGIFNHTHDFENKSKTEEMRTNLLTLVARYTLGYQIEYCLQKNGDCNFSCEY